MKLAEILTEKTVDTLHIGNNWMRLLTKPSAKVIEGECNRILIPLYKNNCDIDSVSLRGILVKDGTPYLWDGHHAIHQELVQQLQLDRYEITTFECGFGTESCFTRQGGGGFGFFAQNAGPLEESAFYPILMKGLEAARIKMVEFRARVDPDTLY
jgi:hypothetical protein